MLQSIRGKLSFSLFFLIFWFSFSFSLFSPKLPWYTLETPHFSIHYTQETEVAAKEAQTFVEDIFHKITRKLKYTPPDKIDLIFVNNDDSVNGYADYFRQTIVIEVSSIPSSELGPFHRLPLYDMITHEMTHIIHLTMNFAPDTIYSLTKRLTAKGIFYPQYLIEGLAVYYEKAVADSGRLYNGSFEAMLMAFAKSNNFPKLTQLATPSMLRWPMGEGKYYVGSKFVEYLSETYGPEKLVESFQKFTGPLFAAGYDQAFYDSFQTTIERAYLDFVSLQKNKYLLLSLVETPSSLLFENNGALSGLELGPNSSFLSYFFEGKEDPKIVSIKDGQVDQVLYSDSHLSSEFHYTPAGLFIKKTVPKDSYGTEDDLYYFSFSEHNEELIAQDCEDFVVSNNCLAYVHTSVSQDSLIYQPNWTSANSSVITTADSISFPAFSSDGKNLAYDKRSGFFEALYTYDFASHTERLLCSGNIREIIWSDPQTIYFVADWNGLPQLYQFSILNSSISRLTSVANGMSAPLLNDKSLYFLTNTANGTAIEQVSVLDFNPSAVEIPTFDEVLPDEPPLAKDEDQHKDVTANHVAMVWSEYLHKQEGQQVSQPPQPYNPFELRLLYFVPYLSFSTLGSNFSFSTMINDPLQFNQFAATMMAGDDYQQYDISYLYTGMIPYLQCEAAKQSWFLEDVESNTEQFVWPIQNHNDSQQYSFGLMQNKYSPTENYQYLSFTHVFSNIRYYPYSISVEQGVNQELSLRSNLANGLFTYCDTFGLYLPGLGENHVLKTEITYGYSQDSTFYIGGYPNTYYVRGYKFDDVRNGEQLSRLSVEYRWPILIVDDQTLFQYYLYSVDGIFFSDWADVNMMGMPVLYQPYAGSGFLLQFHGMQSGISELDFGLGLATTPKDPLIMVFSFGASPF